MWHSLKIGAAMVVVVGLVMSGLSIAGAVEGPDAADTDQVGPEQVIVEALEPLVADGSISIEQAEAVAGELASIFARVHFQARTQEIAKRLTRLAAEIAEVLGLSPDDLTEQLEKGRTLAEIAEENGSTGESLISQVVDHIGAHLAVRVTAGKLDQARADEISAGTEQILNELIEVEHPFGSVLKERRNRAIRAASLAAAGDVLGLPIDEIRDRLEDGSTLAQIADAEGVAEEALVVALLEPIDERIEQAVDRGDLTEEEAAERLAEATERIVEAIHRVHGSDR